MRRSRRARAAARSRTRRRSSSIARSRSTRTARRGSTSGCGKALFAAGLVVAAVEAALELPELILLITGDPVVRLHDRIGGHLVVDALRARGVFALAHLRGVRLELFDLRVDLIGRAGDRFLIGRRRARAGAAARRSWSGLRAAACGGEQEDHEQAHAAMVARRVSG